MSITLFFLSSLWNFSGIDQACKIVLKGLSVHDSSWGVFSKDTQSVAGSLSQNTALFLRKSCENVGELEPFNLEDFITQIFNHIVNQEDTEFIHNFRLSFFESAWKDVGDQEFSQLNGHALVSFEQYTNKL